MQRVQEIIGSVFTFFFKFFKLFFVQLFQALYFRAQEFDSELQQNSSTTTRIFIWIGIALLSFGAVILLLTLLYNWISSINVVEGL